MEMRKDWEAQLRRLTGPVMEALAAGELRKRMPVQHHPEVGDREQCSHLEAFGRSLAGLAPWLRSGEGEGVEEMRGLALRALEQAVDPGSPDYLFDPCPSAFAQRQALVDSSYLVLGILRAPEVLWEPLPRDAREQLVRDIRALRRVPNPFNNWLLFAAMNEAFLCFAGEEDWDYMRIDYAVRAHEMRYKGDGIYGDGPTLHMDYYNSYVIHPYLLEILEALRGVERMEMGWWEAWYEPMRRRMQRYAEIQERLIGPGGEYPPLGRSLVYRCGAFQALAMTALRGWLPESLRPAQVRGALDAVIRRTLDAPGTFDAEGWLRIGICGDQPSLGEVYISTGSLYMASLAFLPLGLPATDAFWQNPPEPWTMCRLWAGEDLPPQHGLNDFTEILGGTPH